MISFVNWIQNNPFYIRDAWSDESKSMHGPGRMKLMGHQIPILKHCLTPDENGKLPYTTIVYSTTKKSGKSAVAAAITWWYAIQLPENSEIYLLANSLDQSSGRILRDIQYHAKKENSINNKEDNTPIKVLRDEVVLPNGTFIKSIPAEASSSAGSRHAMTVWDELWGFSSELSRRLWDEMTPIPTVENSLRLVVTYAGIMGESDLLWDLYTQGVGEDEHEDGRGTPIAELSPLPAWKNGQLFTYWNHEPTMPWQTREYYEGELASNRPAAYQRLHENRWVTGNETFIPDNWWTRATRYFSGPSDFTPAHPYRSFPVYIAVDGAQKHDCMAVVGVTYDQKRGKLIQLFHRIWTPTKGDTLNLDETLGPFLWQHHSMYNVVDVAYDPALLVQYMLTQKSKGLPVSEFTQTPVNMIKASQCFYDLLKYGNYETYPDEEVSIHIRNTIAKEEARGFRLVRDKNRRSTKPMDFSIAAAMASFRAVNSLAPIIATPIRITSPFSDATGWATDQTRIPFPFRE